MPTGYTAAIKDGISFDRFIWGCARAFGALVTMRDDPSDAPIPERLEPSDHYRKWVGETKAELARLAAMSIEQVQAAAETAYQEALASWQRQVQESTDLRNKYSSMLAEVVKWEPPTPDHQGLKDFMLQQIQESIRFDCGYEPSKPVKQKPTTWHNEQIERTREMLARYEHGWAEELDRTATRNAWLDALRKSVDARG